MTEKPAMSDASRRRRIDSAPRSFLAATTLVIVALIVVFDAGYLSMFAQRVRERGGSVDCFPFDGHWNHHGSRVAGQLLNELFHKELSH